MKEKLQALLLEALAAAQAAGELPALETIPAWTLEAPKNPEHGDVAANLALQLARPCHRPPRQVAEIILKHLPDPEGILQKTAIAGPGFLNFTFAPAAWFKVVPEILARGRDFGRPALGKGEKIMVEFVSANPTGPLHVGHGRGAVLGDVLARLLAFAGYAVTTEYYINDAGNQMNTLGRSLIARARELKGEREPFPENHYRGAYMVDLAREWLAGEGRDARLALDDPRAVAAAAAWAGGHILAGIKDDLAAFGVSIENYYSERSLTEAGAVEKGFAALRERGQLYEAEGALWFRASAFGDEKDRVVRRQNGETTYFASDIAYHLDKFARGFVRLIDVWGADHHGYVPRLKAAVEALGRPPRDLDVVLVHLVNLLRAGQPVAMSTRAGEFVTLREVVDEVGKDSARFLFLTRRSEAPLDFDLEVAKQKSLDNPVFYVQYAHTRVMSILRKAREEGVPLPDPAGVDLGRLTLPEEVGLAKLLAAYPEVVAGAAASLEPHRVVYYLRELAQAFHSYYNDHRVLGGDAAQSAARLLLCQAVGAVVAGGLTLLGVAAPEAM